MPELHLYFHYLLLYKWNFIQLSITVGLFCRYIAKGIHRGTLIIDTILTKT